MSFQVYHLSKCFFTCFVLISNLIFFGCSSNSSEKNQETSENMNSNQTEVVLKSSRRFGMDILDVPSTGGYESSLNSLKKLGGEFQTLHMNWSDIEAAGSESTSGIFSDPSDAFSSLNALAISDGIKVTLRIHPIDVTGKFVPSDLASARFNSSVLQTRAKAMINFVFSKISPNNVTSLLMGNEIDGYNSSSDENFWLDYADFLYQINIFLKNNYPTIELGFVITSRGAIDSTLILPNSGGLKAIDAFGNNGWAKSVDFIGITYYPLDSEFKMKSNSLVSEVFQKLVNFTSKPIHIEEVGYSSSIANGGSTQLQAEFFSEIFKAWDVHADRIPSLAILRMVDKSRTDSENIGNLYGLSNNESFIEYIRTLGIKYHDGTEKEAFLLIEQELKKRGF